MLFPHPPSPSLVSPYKGPRNLQTSEPSKTSFRVTWDPAPGDVKGYKVTFHPLGNAIDLGELQVGPYDNTVVLEELRCVFFYIFFCGSVFLSISFILLGFKYFICLYCTYSKNMFKYCGSYKRFVLYHRAETKYTVSVFGMFEGGESVPLAGEEKTTNVSDAPDPLPYNPSGKAYVVNVYCMLGTLVNIDRQ